MAGRIRALAKRAGLLCVLALAGRAVAGNPDPYLKGREELNRVGKPWETGVVDAERLEFHGFFNPVAELPPDSQRLRLVRPDAAKTGLPPAFLLGEMLFRAPALNGHVGRALGTSCESCHPRGGTTPYPRGAGESDRPGNIDPLNPARAELADDGIWGPRNIPSLRGIRYTWPYGIDGSKASLKEVVEFVIEAENQSEAPSLWVQALTRYVAGFDFLPNPRIDALGRLVATASPAAKAGEQLFHKPFEGLGGKSCASCHVPDALFADREIHPLHHGEGKQVTGPTEAFSTPTLLGLQESAPYFFDGSAPDLAAAVKQLDARHHLGLGAEERAALTAFLTDVGHEEGAPVVQSVPRRFAESLAWLDLLLDPETGNEPRLWSFTLDTVRHHLHKALVAHPKQANRAVKAAVQEWERFVASEAAARPSEAGRKRIAELRRKLLAAAH